MPRRQCFHCKEWVNEGEPHDCWTTTEAALTRDLSPDLYDAWERLRETAVGLGEQRIYASHNSIMFSRRSCYFFVRPKRTFLEVCVFLGRQVTSPQISRSGESSKTKFFHIVKVTHRDQVEAPMTDWLREAYAYVPQAGATRSVSAESDQTMSRTPTRKRRGTVKRSKPSRPSPKASTRTRASTRRTKR